MTRNELYTILQRCGWETTPIHTLDKIWGRPFDGETEKINTAKSASLTSEIPQTISTAPIGQRILLYCKRPIESEGWWQIGMLCPDIHRWIDDDYEPDWMLVQPSYWLPLPQPPQPQ
jgi:hypothetical protein